MCVEILHCAGTFCPVPVDKSLENALYSRERFPAPVLFGEGEGMGYTRLIDRGEIQTVEIQWPRPGESPATGKDRTGVGETPLKQ